MTVGAQGCTLKEPNPSKQGLKLTGLTEILEFWSVLRNRIHQNKDWNLVAGNFSQGREDLRNRIHQNKDWNLDLPINQGQFPMLKEPNPSKQGLKRLGPLPDTKSGQLKEPNPSKQGLKHVDREWLVHGEKLKEPNPSKQGLKQRCNNNTRRLWFCLRNRIHQNKVVLIT